MKRETESTTVSVPFAQRDLELYEKLEAAAERDRRTPEQQVLHLLEWALKGDPVRPPKR